MSYSSVVLGDAPVAYWRLQETSGTTAVDSSGNGNTGTYSNVLLNQSQTGINGDVSASFDGSTSKITTSLQTPYAELSVEAWVFRTSNTNTQNPRIVSDGLPASTKNGFDLYVDYGTEDPFFDIGINNVGHMNTSGSTFTFNLNTWYHLVGVWDASTGTISLYMNGVLQHSNTWSAMDGLAITNDGSTTVGIGFNPQYSGDYFQGYIQEVAIYQTVLSATQVQNHYNAATGGSSPTPITASGAFQGQGSLSATANIVNLATINATASFTGQASLSATANLISPVVATASMQGQGSLTATGNGVWLGSASLTGQGSLSSNPVVVLTASSSLSGQGSLTAVVELQDTSVIGTANFYGSSSVVSNPTVSKAPILATANMQGQGSLIATVEVIDIGVANLQGTSYLMANAVLPSQVQVPKVWNVVFDPKKSWAGVFDKTVHTWTGVFDPKKVWVGGE